MLRNHHIQTILPSLQRGLTLRRAAPLIAASRELLLDGGDGVRLQAFHNAAAVRSGRLVVLLHGWEGSANAGYVLSLAQQLLEDGDDVLRLNLRDHGDTHHLNSGIFHSCLLPEVINAITDLAQRFADRRLWLTGFSLGGNFMLRVAASPQAAQLRLGGVVAVSPVIDPAATLLALESGWGLYRSYFVRKWSRSLLRKQSLWPQQHDFRSLLRTRDLRRMTAELVARCTPYAHIDDYLAGYAITGDRLATLAVPAAVLMASDDPIIPVADLARLADNPRIEVTVTRHGGHTGFLERLGRPSWANGFVRRQIAAQAAR